jgi:hypothetical protein
MSKKHLRPIAAVVLAIIILLTLALPSCKSGGPTEGPVSDSLIEGVIKAIRKHSSGYTYDIDFVIESSSDVGTVPNPTKDKVGQTITAWTNENLRELEIDEEFTANVKLVYDKAKTGTIFFVYNVKETGED